MEENLAEEVIASPVLPALGTLIRQTAKARIRKKNK
jgi:hypothetical protein